MIITSLKDRPVFLVIISSSLYAIRMSIHCNRLEAGNLNIKLSTSFILFIIEINTEFILIYKYYLLLLIIIIEILYLIYYFIHIIYILKLKLFLKIFLD